MSTRATRDITVTRNTMDITRTTARRVVTLMASTGGTAVATAVEEATVIMVMVMVTVTTIIITIITKDPVMYQRHSHKISLSATQFLVSVLEDISVSEVTKYVTILATMLSTLLWSKGRTALLAVYLFVMLSVLTHKSLLKNSGKSIITSYNILVLQ
jgi:hypothetical protein